MSPRKSLLIIPLIAFLDLILKTIMSMDHGVDFQVIPSAGFEENFYYHAAVAGVVTFSCKFANLTKNSFVKKTIALTYLAGYSVSLFFHLMIWGGAFSNQL